MLLPADPITLVVLTDVHFGAVGSIPCRRSDIADILLLRAVHRCNRLIRPDVVLVLGDLLDDGTAPGVAGRLAELREILDKLEAPYIAIPGNHDGPVDDFYAVFEHPDESVDIAGVRFLPFIDPEAPGYNATRPPEVLDRFRRARAGCDGPIVALQHVCLVPPDKVDVPYNYTNATEVIAAMAEARVTLSVSGHHHDGAPTARNATTAFVTAPALCEAPFRYDVVTLGPDGVRVETQQLAMPSELRLVDRHVHTQLAYCSENMEVAKAIHLAEDFGLAGLGFAEHSGHLYFPVKQYWGGHYAEVGVAGAEPDHNRVEAYLALRRRYAGPGIWFGLETDVDYAGNLVLEPQDRGRIDFVLGTIHRTPSFRTASSSPSALAEEYMGLLRKLLGHGIDILAHPFRVFRHDRIEPPAHLFGPVAALLREHGVAAELNFHGNRPPLDFVRACLEAGVRFSLGSDAHNLYEIGEFADHLQLLADAGFDGPLSDVLYETPAPHARLS